MYTSILQEGRICNRGRGYFTFCSHFLGVKLRFAGEDVTEASETRARGVSIPPAPPPEKAPAISRHVMNVRFQSISCRTIWREPFRGGGGGNRFPPRSRYRSFSNIPRTNRNLKSHANKQATLPIACLFVFNYALSEPHNPNIFQTPCAQSQ